MKKIFFSNSLLKVPIFRYKIIWDLLQHIGAGLEAVSRLLSGGGAPALGALVTRDAAFLSLKATRDCISLQHKVKIKVVAERFLSLRNVFFQLNSMTNSPGIFSNVIESFGPNGVWPGRQGGAWHWLDPQYYKSNLWPQTRDIFQRKRIKSRYREGFTGMDNIILQQLISRFKNRQKSFELWDQTLRKLDNVQGARELIPHKRITFDQI